MYVCMYTHRYMYIYICMYTHSNTFLQHVSGTSKRQKKQSSFRIFPNPSRGAVQERLRSKSILVGTLGESSKKVVNSLTRTTQNRSPAQNLFIALICLSEASDV